MRTRTSPVTPVLAAACLALLLWLSVPTYATDDFPAEAKGYQSTSYDLSQHESVNLANGNLTFRVPLYTLTTNGGLSYDIALHFNSKLWSHRVVMCMYNDVATEGRVRVADGVPNYGFGWDLRPPRLEMDSECVNLVSPDDPCDEAQLERPLAWVDASGARHYLYDSMPWEPGLSGTVHQHACQFAPGGDPCYSWDGTNLRVTPQFDAENGLLGAVVEDGAGTRYIHTRAVSPAYTNSKRYRDNVPEELDHFQEEVSGFYLSAIERGPYGANGAANRIEFAYCDYDPETSMDTCSLGSLSRPWLLREIRAVGSEERTVTLSYIPFTVQDDPEVRVPVLQTMTTPAFDSGIRQISFGYDAHEVPPSRWDVGLPNNFCSEESPGPAPAPFLRLVEVGGGMSFRFAPCATANYCTAAQYDWVLGSLSQSDLVVQLPAGAQVAYDIGAHTPTGMINTKTIGGTPLESNPAVLQVCNPEADEYATAGVRLRHKASHDAATQAPRVETTWFERFRNCVAFGVEEPPADDLWPYDFSEWALNDPFGLGTAPKFYLATLVHTEAVGQSGDLFPAEIHRFNPITYEEFSIDYLAPDLPYCDFDPETGAEAVVDCFRVLRHEEFERALRFDRPFDLDDRPGDTGSYLAAHRSYTDPAAPLAEVSDAHDCYEGFDPPDPSRPCAVVETATTVDERMNVRSALTSTISMPLALSELEVNRLTLHGFDDTTAVERWWLALEETTDVCDDFIMNGEDPQCAGARWSHRYQDWEWDELDIRYELISSVTDGGSGDPCEPDPLGPSDCVKHEFSYDDAFGNLTAELVTGGFRLAGLSGCSNGPFTTHWLYEHGKPVEKWLEGTSGGTLMLWKREVDPGTGLARWHVGGDGVGSAFLYDEIGRVTDIAPVTFNGQSVSVQLDSSLLQPMRGVHVEYMQPDQDNLLRHLVYDATYGISSGQLSPVWTGTAPRSQYHLDGFGRETAFFETLPGATGTRARFTLSYLGTDHLWRDHTPIRRVSEFVDWTWSSGGEHPLLTEDPPWTETELDGLGRPVRTTLPDGTFTDFAYWGDTRVRETRQVRTSILSSSDRWTDRYTDALGRLRKLEEQVDASTHNVTTYTYDQDDRLTDVHLGDQERTFTYSEAGFLKQEVHPEITGSVTHLGYDPLGNLCSSSAGGVTTNLLYDQFGRLATKKLGIQVASELTYGPGLWIPSYNKITRSIQHNRFPTRDVKVTHDYGYEGPGGSVSSRTTSVSGLGTTNDRFRIGYEYDTWGNRSAVALPVWEQGPTMCTLRDRTHFDAEWDGPWLKAAWLSDVDMAAEVVVQGNVQYLPSGRPERVTLGTGLAFLREVADPAGIARPSKISLDWSDGNSPEWTTGDYAYDGSGNIYQIGDRKYVYDGLNRLSRYQDLSQQHIFSYDRYGNMEDHGDISMEYENTHSNRLKRLEGVDLPLGAYDDRGNLLYIPAFSLNREKQLVFSGDDRVMSATDVGSGIVTHYAYDAGGERVAAWSRTGGGNLRDARFFIRDEAGQVVSEWLYTGVSFDLVKDYLSVGGRTYAEHDHLGDPDRLHFFAADHLGSTRLVFRLGEGSGRVVDQLDYLPYGGLEYHSDLPETTHLFTGHERDLGDTSSQLDYLHARYYSNTLARFVSVDSVGGQPGSSQSWNRYSYALNNPLRLVDPDGRVALPAENIERIRTATTCIYHGLLDVPIVGPVLAAAYETMGGKPNMSNAEVAGLVSMSVMPAATTAAPGASAVKNSRLLSALNKLYQPSDKLPGGTAGAIRHQLSTGELVRGRDHIVAGLERLRGLNKILGGEELAEAERVVAEREIKNLQEALDPLLKQVKMTADELLEKVNEGMLVKAK